LISLHELLFEETSLHKLVHCVQSVIYFSGLKRCHRKRGLLSKFGSQKPEPETLHKCCTLREVGVTRDLSNVCNYPESGSRNSEPATRNQTHEPRNTKPENRNHRFNADPQVRKLHLQVELNFYSPKTYPTGVPRS
jgi:hypothetical protein